MAKIGDLPVELVDLITDHLCRARDLAAFARTSQKFYSLVDPILYKFAKEQVPKQMAWHPLRWAAETGQTGTVKKALAAGIDVNMRFVSTTFMRMRDLESFQIRIEAVDGHEVWDPPPDMESNQEWRPHEDDTDDDGLSRSSSTVDQVQPRYSPPRRHFPDPFLSDLDDDEGIDDFDAGMIGFEDEDEADFMPGFHHPFVEDYWSEDEPIDDDDDEMPDEDENGGRDEDSHANGRDSDEEDDLVGSFRAVHLAARGGHNDVVRVLLDHGASIDVFSRVLCRCVPILARSALGRGIPLVRNEMLGFSPLHLAICHFQASTAKLLLFRGASIRLSEPQRHSASTALHAAAATGQVELCKHILDEGLVDVDVVDHSGLTPFYYAYMSEHWNSTVSFLLEKGADINFLICHPTRLAPTEGGEFSTTLYEACVFGRFTDAVRLINLGANVNKGHYRQDVQYKWPLHAVCQPPRTFDEPLRIPTMRASAPPRNNEEQRMELIRLMLKSGADLEAKTHQDLESPLQYAAMHFDVAALQVLLAEGADVESRNCRGRTPLLRACGPEITSYDSYAASQFLVRGAELDAIKMLLDHGSKINATDDDGNTALHLACTLNHNRHDRRYDSDQKQERIVRMLLQRGAKDNVPNKLGFTPFESAFSGGLLGVCDILVRRRRSLQPWKHEDFDRMFLATIRDRPHDLEAVDLLLDLDINGILFNKSTYVMKMIEGGHVKMANRYLERGASRPPLSPKEKITIIQEGLARGNEALVKQMLAMKVSVNFPDKNGHTPLYVVLQSVGLPGKEGLVRELLDAGADIHFKPQSSTIMTPLEKAVMVQQHKLVEIMLHRHPLRNNPKAPKGVYLHAAARTVPSKRMFSTLIRSGASVTELDSNGDTPLSVFLKSVADQPHWMAHTRGAANQVCATVWFLWNKDVDVNLRNKSGKSIISYLTALRIYNGDNLARKRIADELQLCVEVVPAKGPDGAKGLKMLRFRHGLMALGRIGSHGGDGGTRPHHRLRW
ncbi:hypothetical protein J7T55_004932 [Diaporthe amygdali]|uniref:uncharacterized protein n=1 Tax=Phomopsis amygdali TaxID=1214568 RepID=UPI0022FF3B83|nr:uncharacterized protein J7T55_004932 [Diaporthe amygdali]KAJ0114688.1 hypothetical protein J7T55_004932 [Diaporthe amygdali]